MATSTDPAPPADAQPAPAVPETPAPQSADAAGVYQYLDETPRTYCFTDGTVITPRQGDVCPIPYDPGDGRWKPSKARVTRLPDNHPDQAARDAAEQAEQRTEVHKAAAAAAAIETGKAAS